MKITIDRFEGDFAVAETENGEFVDFPKKLLPSDCREGDVIIIEKSPDETEKHREKIAKLTGELFK